MTTKKAENLTMDDMKTTSVECPQGHAYTIDPDIIETVAGTEVYECPDCEMQHKVSTASRRAGWS